MAENSSLDLISITAFRRGDIAADHATLGVTIEGASLVTGQSALHKAREVKALADALRAFGLKDSDIELEGVSATTTSGTFGKSSSARYSVRVRVGDLEALPDVVGIITSQKNTELQPIRWGFPDGGPWRDEWLDGCLAEASARARRVAQGLGVPLLGVHRFAESWSDAATPPPVPPPAAPAPPAMMSRARVSSDELGLSVSHFKQVTLSTQVQFIVGRMEAR